VKNIILGFRPYDLAQFCEILYKDSSVNLYLAKKQVHHMQFFITDGLKPKIIFFTTTGPNDLYEIQNHKLPITALLSFKSRKN
jgi:wobble nucleotide-excising tRNase